MSVGVKYFAAAGDFGAVTPVSALNFSLLKTPPMLPPMLLNQALAFTPTTARFKSCSLPGVLALGTGGGTFDCPTAGELDVAPKLSAL